MKRYLYTGLLAFAMTAAEAQNSIDSIMQAIRNNNLELNAMKCDNNATILEMKADNTITGPSVEYSPFFAKGVDGIATSELIVSQEFDFPTLYAMRKKEARITQQALNGEYLVRQREILLTAYGLCYDIIEQNQRIELLNESVKQSGHIAELLQKRMEAGDANALELNKALMERMQAEQDLVEAQNLRESYMQQLRVLNGNKDITLEDKRFPEVAIPAKTYLTNMPEITSADNNLQASKYAERIAKKGWLPNITVGYRRNTEDEKSLNGFLVGMSFNLFNSSKKIKAAQQRRETAELRLQQARLTAQSEQQSRYKRLKELQQVMDHSNVKLLRETLPLLDKALQHGQISVLNYYAEYNALYDKLLQHITIHNEYMKLYTQLYVEGL